MKIVVVLLGTLCIASTVLAEGPVNIKTIAQPMASDQTVRHEPAADYAQTDGVVQVVAEPNRGRSRTVRFISTKPLRGVLFARVLLPNGESFGLEKFDLDRCCGPTMISMDLWDGNFPPNWPYGLTRFDVYNAVDGRITRTSGYVDVSTSGIVPEPNLGNIGLVNAEHGRQVLVSQGPFKSNNFLAVVIGFVPADRFAVNQLGQLTVTVPAGGSPGNTTVTICQDGLCGTRMFFYNPFPPPPGGPPPSPPPGTGGPG